MANLSETATWVPGIYQWELTDVVQGGPDGIDNVPTGQLANRTAYLKQEVELRAPLNSPALTGTPEAPTPAHGTDSLQIATTAFVQAALAAILNAPPATLDTLNELAAALGDDPNFATTITNMVSALQTALATHEGLLSDEAAAGHIKLATAAAVAAGLETDTAVSPATLQQALASRAFLEASLQVPVSPPAGALWALTTLVASSSTVDPNYANGVLTIAPGMEGVWAITTHAHWTGSALNPYTAIMVNGAQRVLSSRPNWDLHNNFAMSVAATLVELDAGDTVNMAAFTNTVNANLSLAQLHATRVSR